MQALASSRSVAVRPFTSARALTVDVQARVALRFQRHGRKKSPFYRLVAVDSKKRRDGEPLEYLGWYDPLHKETNLNAPSIKRWLSVGALPSETVESLLRKAFVIDQKPPYKPPAAKVPYKKAAAPAAAPAPAKPAA